MKILEIREHKGFFRLSESARWQAIDTIDKDALLALLDLYLESDVTMDAPDEENLGNQAHSIIYRNVYGKFVALSDEKNRFTDESQRLYLEEIKRYSELAEE